MINMRKDYYISQLQDFFNECYLSAPDEYDGKEFLLETIGNYLDMLDTETLIQEYEERIGKCPIRN